MRLDQRDDGIDNQRASHLKQELAEQFREQLTVGVPTRADEKGLRQLARQIRDEKVKVKLFRRQSAPCKTLPASSTRPNRTDSRLPRQ